MIDFARRLVGVLAPVGSLGLGIDVAIVSKAPVGGGEVWKFVLCALLRRGSTVATTILARFESLPRVLVRVFGRKGHHALL